MKTNFCFAVLSILFLISCSTAGSESQQEKEKISYEQTKSALLQKESNNPTMFLAVSGNDKRNLIGQTVIKGKISSQATVAVYKDIEIKLQFFSKTKTLLESDKETIYLQIRPGRTESFKTKYFAPKGTDSVALSIINAKVAE